MLIATILAIALNASYIGGGFGAIFQAFSQEPTCTTTKRSALRLSKLSGAVVAFLLAFIAMQCQENTLVSAKAVVLLVSPFCGAVGSVIMMNLLQQNSRRHLMP